MRLQADLFRSGALGLRSQLAVLTDVPGGSYAAPPCVRPRIHSLPFRFLLRHSRALLVIPRSLSFPRLPSFPRRRESILYLRPYSSTFIGTPPSPPVIPALPVTPAPFSLFLAPHHSREGGNPYCTSVLTAPPSLVLPLRPLSFLRSPSFPRRRESILHLRPYSLTFIRHPLRSPSFLRLPSFPRRLELTWCAASPVLQGGEG